MSFVAVPVGVLMGTVTLFAETAESVAVTVTEPPVSDMLDALVERLTVGSVSSLLIVPVAVVVAPRMAFVTAETVTAKVSLPSVIVSPQTVTSMLPELVFEIGRVHV